jgi:hypothetical protein
LATLWLTLTHSDIDASRPVGINERGFVFS